MGLPRSPYAEWAPPAPLRQAVMCLWSGISQDGGEVLVLPDACSDLIWEQGRGVYLAGPDTGPAPSRTPPGTVTVGVRFGPWSGGPVLGLPLSKVRDQRVDLRELLPAAAGRLSPDLDPCTALDRLTDLAGSLVEDSEPDAAMAHATRLLRDPAARTEHVAAEVGLSDRQLRRRSQAAAGYGPKTLQRVLRFRAFVSRLDASPPGSHPDLAALAADTGYADQAHLTRECVSLSGLTPAVLLRVRRS